MYNMGYNAGYTTDRQDAGYNTALQAAYRRGFNGKFAAFSNNFGLLTYACVRSAGYATVENAPPAPSGGFQRRSREVSSIFHSAACN